MKTATSPVASVRKPAPEPAALPNARAWRHILSAYQQPDLWKAIREIVLSLAPLAAIWAAAWTAAAYDQWWLALLLTVPAGFFIVRMFMVQHDCGHHSFFKNAAVNDWVGRIVGVLTLTPYDCWRREHAVHHATSGDLDRRGVGAVETMTVAEYRNASKLKRLIYRVYRNPLVLFAFGPSFVFFLQQRLPIGLMKQGWRPWVSAMGTNLGLVAMIALAVWLGGWKPVLLFHLPSLAIAASIGVWLFYVQHQFEQTYWARRGKWEISEAALHGSSHYDLPAPLRWLTGNIGVHHVHHVSARIPFYRLHKVLKDHPELKDVGRLSLLDSFRCVGLSLWDEASQRLISFRQFHRQERRLAAV
jgi:omega-6 fatty acid desaturase (delta-12 desaturase)